MRFAVIVDEAHSSQTGDAARKLKRALADTDKVLEEYAAEEAAAEEATRKDDEDKLLEELAAQGVQENLSFFAFTATPKDKTLQMFGRRDANGKYHPFHMCIRCGRPSRKDFISGRAAKLHDLSRMYYKIAKAIPDDPELDTAAGVRAIRQFETLHPHNISQKTAIMLEQFRNVTRHKIGGKAKAMMVTPSRLHAVRYLLEFKRQIQEKGYTDLDVLVAFSGEVEDNGEHLHRGETEHHENRARPSRRKRSAAAVPYRRIRDADRGGKVPDRL